MPSKPFRSYNGGKAGNGTYQQIINHIPKCDVFIDAMVGNGGVFFNLALPVLSIINDVDGSVIEKYRDLIASSGDAGAAAVIVRNDDYARLIDEFDNVSRKAFFYFDPPYLKSSRKSQKDLYRFEWTEADHIRFLTMAISARSDVMISHYPCKLYDEMLKGWNTHDFESQTRNGKATERIYMNYQKPEVLQDFRYLGTDFRDRQRIKRKISRWLGKLEAMPADERTGILSAVIAKYGATAGQLLNAAS